jgi:hypothetical protein
VTHISIEDLIEIVIRDPRYGDWTKQVSAPAALCISFHSGQSPAVKTVVHEAADGNQIVLEMGPDGKVYGIEIT